MVEQFNDGGPQFFACASTCREVFEWHRCRGTIGCKVRSCIVSRGGGKNPPFSYPFGKTYWCNRCGGYIEYNHNIDTLYEGPWQ